MTMKFERTLDSLEVLEKQENLTMFDALNVFYDLCEDVRSSGESIDKLAVGDEDQAVGRLCWAARTLVRISDQHSEMISNSRRAEAWERVDSELVQTDGKLEKALSSIEGLNQKYEDLRGKKEQIAEAAKQEQTLWEQCLAMLGEMQEIEDARKPDIEARYEETSQKLQTAQNELGAAKAELEKTEADLASIRQAFSETEAEREKLLKQSEEMQTSRQILSEENERLCQSMEEKNALELQVLTESHEQKIKTLTEKNDQKVQALTKENEQKIKNLIDEHSRMIQKLTETYAQKVRTITEENDQRIQTLTTENEHTMRTLTEENKQKIQTLTEEHQQKVQALEGEKLQKLQALETEKSALEKSTEEFHKQEKQLTEENKKMRDTTVLLGKRVDQLHQEKARLLSQRSAAQKALKDIQDWGGGLEAAQYKKELEVSRARAERLKALQTELFKEMNIYSEIAKTSAAETLSITKGRLSDMMAKIDEDISTYQRSYMRLTHLFEEGGSSL